MFYRVRYQPFIQAIQFVRSSEKPDYTTAAGDKFRKELFDAGILNSYVPDSLNVSDICPICNKSYASHGIINDRLLVIEKSALAVTNKTVDGIVLCPDDWIIKIDDDKYSVVTDLLFNMVYSPILTN